MARPEPIHFGYEIETPFAVDFGRDGTLDCEQVVRVIPGRRIVCRGRWHGEEVFAKLYAQGRNAERDFEQELAGNEALRSAGIPAPGRVYAGIASGNRAHAIVYSAIIPATDFEDAWRAAAPERRHDLLMDVVELVARHHESGLYQRDMHWGNFLLSDDRIHTLDGGDIQIRGAGLPRREALANLALLLSQLQPSEEESIRAAYLGYVALRGWEGERGRYPAFLRSLDRTRARKTRRYLKKVFRESSAFVSSRTSAEFRVHDRAYSSASLDSLLADPDRAIASGTIVKAGNTCTVALVQVAGRRLIVKRYNVKSLIHGMRNSVGRTRAARSWRNAHLLRFCAIPTAMPVALVERRESPLSRRSFFVMEEAPGRSAQDYFSDGTVPLEEKRVVADRIVEILRQLAAHRISHGDLKATNFIVDRDAVALIDLDAMRAHARALSFRRASRRDLRRFMANWREEPEVHELFRERLSKLHSGMPLD